MYVAALSRVLPGHSVDWYLNNLPYSQGIQLQAIDCARQGVKFQQTSTTGAGESFEEIAGISF
tara:strand:- start:3780 stop:3968 length:189 start_codon:yes stop_codon:yes gene_type:complete